MLPGDRARKVVEKVEQHCLPPSCFALSHQATHDTVDPIPAALQSAMEPTPRELFGRGCWEPFITAYIKDEWRKEEARRQAQAWLSPLESHLTEAGLGDVSEIFEGDAPHRPRVYRSGLERGRNSTRLF